MNKLPLETIPETKKSRRLFVPLLLTSVVVIALLGSVATAVLNMPPAQFTSPTVLTIEPGTSVTAITTQLEAARVVRSATFLYLVLNVLYNPEDIKASTYVFDEPFTTHRVAGQLVAGDFSSDLLRFTHIEGDRATDIAVQATGILQNFDTETFLQLAVPLEGRLYPDTYYVPKTYTAPDLVNLMVQTFDEKTAPFADEIAAHHLSFDEIVVLASLLEREANSPESMQIVSGILQERLTIDMPLQADASIEYVLKKPLKELTPEELKIDSPYNTYRNRGLPPTPIGNPGLTAIQAVLRPTKTAYLYYLTDDAGTFHYATTYDEHLDNIERYLR